MSKRISMSKKGIKVTTDGGDYFIPKDSAYCRHSKVLNKWIIDTGVGDACF